jgi:hypothetical protein
MLKYYLPPDCSSRAQPPVQCRIGTLWKLSSAGLCFFRGSCRLFHWRRRLTRSAPPPIFRLFVSFVRARPGEHPLGTFPTFPLDPGVDASCCLRGGQTLHDTRLSSGIVVHKGHTSFGSPLVGSPYALSARLAEDEILVPLSQHANWILID